jgi:hypothetical protein
VQLKCKPVNLGVLYYLKFKFYKKNYVFKLSWLGLGLVNIRVETVLGLDLRISSGLSLSKSLTSLFKFGSFTPLNVIMLYNFK